MTAKWRIERAFLAAQLTPSLLKMTDTPSKAALYRHEAAACMDVAELMPTKAQRDRMMEMARELLEMARQSELQNEDDEKSKTD